jgi:hypothetical protein
MARRKKTLSITADQALQALQVFVHDGKILAQDVSRAIQRRDKLVRQLRARLEALGDEGARMAGRLQRRAAPQVRKAISKARRAAYQAQGRYMAAVRALPKSTRVKIKKIRQSSGVDAAIKAARQMARK